MNRITRYFTCRRIMRLGEEAMSEADAGNIAKALNLIRQANKLERGS